MLRVMELKGLYYPFSRCINLSSLKQMFLVFDNIVFLDSIENDERRASLIRNLIPSHGEQFKKYDDIHILLKELKNEGAITCLSPNNIKNLNYEAITCSSISDLLDNTWSSIASKPDLFDLPYRNDKDNNRPLWHIFDDKLPDSFIEILSNKEYSNHVFVKGGEHRNWTLSYEAGSAIATNFHLAVASKLKLSPITDSVLHHQLLINKSLRAQKEHGLINLNSSVSNSISSRISMNLLDNLLNDIQLQNISIEDILKFREKTKQLRCDFEKEISFKVLKYLTDFKSSSLECIEREIIYQTEKDIRNYNCEILSARDKIFPTLLSSFNQGLAGGGIAAVSFNYLGGADYLLLGSILGASLSFLKGSLTIKNDIKNVKRKMSPTVSYLTRIRKAFQ